MLLQVEERIEHRSHAGFGVELDYSVRWRDAKWADVQRLPGVQEYIVFPYDVSRTSKAMLLKAFNGMVEKFRLAELRHKWRDAWTHDLNEQQCQKMFDEHVRKGDPRDVAIICAIMLHYGWKTNTELVPQVVDGVARWCPESAAVCNTPCSYCRTGRATACCGRLGSAPACCDCPTPKV